VPACALRTRPHLTGVPLLSRARADTLRRPLLNSPRSLWLDPPSRVRVRETCLARTETCPREPRHCRLAHLARCANRAASAEAPQQRRASLPAGWQATASIQGYRCRSVRLCVRMCTAHTLAHDPPAPLQAHLLAEGNRALLLSTHCKVGAAQLLPLSLSLLLLLLLLCRRLETCLYESRY
jgi:hypothetical protein